MPLRPRIPLEAFAAAALALVLSCSDSASAVKPIVYMCESQGGRVFSDRPCGADARLHRVEIAPAVQRVARPRATVAAQPQRPAPRRRTATPNCHALQQSIDDIDARMRLGYSGKEGEKLYARRNAATGRYRELRCNTTAVRPPR